MAAIDDLYDQVGGMVTGQVQDYLDQIYQGAKNGSLAEGDVIAALNIVKGQAAQGMTGAGGAAPGIVAPGATGGGGAGDAGSVVDSEEFSPREGATAILRRVLQSMALKVCTMCSGRSTPRARSLLMTRMLLFMQSRTKMLTRKGLRQTKYVKPTAFQSSLLPPTLAWRKSTNRFLLATLCL
jgi:hypothetical protein